MPQKRVKSTGAQVLKNIMNAVKKIENDDGAIKTNIKVKSSAQFTDLKTITKKFPKEAEAAHYETLQIVAEELELALGIAMESKVWGWTYGDGDIIQSGRLRDSVRVEVEVGQINIMYSAENPEDGYDYAGIVYYGGYIHPYGNPYVSVYMPGRPWIKGVLLGGGPVEKFDFTGTYKKYFETFLKKKLGPKNIK